MPPDTVIRTLRSVATGLRQELVVTEEAPLRLRARIADLRVEAATEPDPPHRLTGLRIYPAMLVIWPVSTINVASIRCIIARFRVMA